MLDSRPAFPESSEYYRDRASQMFMRAQKALSQDMRTELLNLAKHWECMAETSEHQRQGPPANR